MTGSARREELAAGLARVRERVAAAARSAGRDPGEVTLCVVTKTWPLSDVVALRALGVVDLGENRVAEAADKAAGLASLPVPAGVPAPRWHQLGTVQTNKAAATVAWADVVQSVDRPRVVTALARAAERAGRGVRPVEVLLQVSLDGDPARGGADPADVPALADLVAAAPALRLGGVMAVAPLGAEPAAAFARLHVVAEALRAQHPAARTVSAGMSGDLEAAVEAGSTCVRVGAAVLGSRVSAPRPPGSR